MCFLIRVVSRYHFTFTIEYIHIVLKTFLPLVTGCCRFDQITRGKIIKNWKIHHSLFDGGHFDFNTTSSPGSSRFPVAAISKSERTLGARLRSADVGSHTSPSVKRSSRRNFFRWWNPTWPESPSCFWPKISFVWARQLTNWRNRCRNVFNLLLTKEYVESEEKGIFLFAGSKTFPKISKPPFHGWLITTTTARHRLAIPQKEVV